MEFKLLAHDFKNGRLPSKVGQKAVINQFMGYADVKVIITSIHDGFVFAKLAES